MTSAPVELADLLPPWPGRLVSTSGGPLYVRRAEPTASSTEPALLVHGLGGSSLNWTDLMGLLRDRLDAHAPDLPGFGHSPPPADGDYTPAGYARAVVRLLEQSGRGPVHLFGNSLGGAVATRVAALRPDLVRTLTLVSPALPDLRPRRSNVGIPLLAVPLLGTRLARLLARQTPERRAAALIDLCFGDPSLVPDGRRAEAVEEIRRRASLPYAEAALIASTRGLLRDYFAPGGAERPWGLAARVQAPTLLLYGGRDKLVDARMARRAGQAFRARRVVVLPRAGHVAQVEYADVVAGEFRQLLGMVSGEATVEQSKSRSAPS